MRDLNTILEAIANMTAADEPFVMATLVESHGSTYRKAGARMLVTAKGPPVGTISAGCLEHDIIEKTARILASGTTQLLKYDSTSEEDILWGSGSGCGGETYALVDSHPSLCPAFAKLREYLNQDLPAIFATVYRYVGSNEGVTGQRFLFCEKEIFLPESCDPILKELIQRDAGEVFAARKNTTRNYELPHGRVDVLVEFISPPQSLFVFGGGPDVYPLLDFAKLLGWRTTVVENREAFAKPDRFPVADAVLFWGDEPFVENLGDRAACVIMTHNYLADKKMLPELLKSQANYVGLIGPQTRLQNLLEDIRKEGIALSAAMLEKLFSPIGLDVGSDGPDEIALSIIAEIQAVTRGRTGGLLRNRKGSIHGS